MDTNVIEITKKIPSVEGAPDAVRQIIGNLNDSKLVIPLQDNSVANNKHRLAAEKLAAGYLDAIPPEQRAASYAEVLKETSSVYVMGEVVSRIATQIDLQANEQLIQAVGTSAEKLVASHPYDVLHTLASVAKTNPEFALEEVGRIATMQRDEGKPGGKWEDSGLWLDDTINVVCAVLESHPSSAVPETAEQIEAVFNTLAEVPLTTGRQKESAADGLNYYLQRFPARAVLARRLLENVVTFQSNITLHTLASVAKTNPEFALEEVGRIATMQRDEGKPGGKWEDSGLWLEDTINIVCAVLESHPSSAVPETAAQIEAVFNTLAEVPLTTARQKEFTADGLNYYLQRFPARAVLARRLIEEMVEIQKGAVGRNESLLRSFLDALGTRATSSQVSSPVTI